MLNNGESSTRTATAYALPSGENDKAAPTGNLSSSLSMLPGPVRDFSSFMMFFNDMFLQDSYYSNFNLTNDLPMSSIVGEGAQFSVKRLALHGGMAVRTSDDPRTRMTNGDNIILKKPRLDKAFLETKIIDGIVQELRILSHPPLRTHEKILDVYGFAWETERVHELRGVWPVLMVEYAALGTLQDCLDNEGPLTLDEKIGLVTDVAEGLVALHQCGIVHSDLKPLNVLVCRRKDGGFTAKLADFGSSVIIQEAVPFEPWRQGTFGWMAPEWLSEVPLESLHMTDIYSCGLLLWTILLDGQQPWEHEIFGTNPKENIYSFEAFKKRGNDLLDIACSLIMQRYPENEATVAVPLLQGILQHNPSHRSFDSLFSRTSNKEKVSLKAQTQEGFMETEKDSSQVPNSSRAREVGRLLILRQIFSDFSELRALPLSVQQQLRAALIQLSEDKEQPLWRRAESCYSLSIFYIERIGTIRLISDGNQRSEYTGYDADATRSLDWLWKAAKLGSHKAQAIYFRMKDALSIPVTSTELSSIKPWLIQAAQEGSRVAAEDLKSIDKGLCIEAKNVLNSKFCGTGLQMQEGNIYRAILARDLLEFISLLSSSASEKTLRGDSLLHCAAMSGFFHGVVHLLTDESNQISIDAVNSLNETALLQACRSGHWDIVELLLSAAADASIFTVNRENPLHWLCSFEFSEEKILVVASSLVAAGAEVDQCCTENAVFNSTFIGKLPSGTPLRRATVLNNKTAVSALLKLGADPYDGGGDNNPPIAEACLAHYSGILELFIPPNFEIRHPGWYRQPVLRKRDILETVFAIIGRAKSMAIAAPRTWANFEKQGTAKSLLGYAVNPKLLHERMILHGGVWKVRMQDTINSILQKGEEDYSRVSPINTSAILEAVLSSDIEIVSHLLEACPEILPFLSYPRPNGYSFWLPIHGAIAQQNKPIFTRLLQAAGPETPLSHPAGSGFSNWIESKFLEAGGQTIGTCPPGQQFSTVLHLCASATTDPYFAEAILDKIADPRTLVMTPGHFGEMPLVAAICNQSFALAEVIIENGAHPELGGRPGPWIGAMAAGIGLSWSQFLGSTLSAMSLEGGQSPLAWVLRLNNEASAAGVEWLLHRGASFIVDEAVQLSAIHLAVQGGHRFKLEEESMEQMFFYSCNLSNLRLVLQYFHKPEELDFRDGLMGYTAVHWAVFQRDIGALTVLKKAGAKLDTTSNKGITPLQLLELLREVPAPVQKRGRKAVLEYHKRMEELRGLLQESGDEVL